ncbi:MAG: cation-efflux pump [Chloroflexi bacterium]|nr:cation-efflux pump [Chloroflexota bacterium]
MRDYSAIRRTLIITMLLNFVASAVKLGAGFATGALSLVADGLDTLFDAVANIVGLVGISIGSRPPDEDHPYGHRKFETFAALIIALLLFVAAWELGSSAVARMRNPQPITLNAWAFAALVFSIVIQAGTSAYELRKGRHLHSEVLVADALHTRSSILASLAVMVGLIAVWLGYPLADPIITLFVALFIAKIGVDIVRENSPALLDQAAVDQDLVSDIVRGVPGVESYHRIRSRGHTDASSLDLHVRVAPYLSMQQANAIADEVRRRLLALDSVADVTIHIEAQYRAEQESAGIYATVQQAARESGLQVHEFWVHKIDGNLILELHVGVSPDLTVGEAHDLVDQFETICLERISQLSACQSHIELHNPEILPVSHVSRTLRRKVQDAVYEAVDKNPGLHDPHNINVRQSEGRLTISFEVITDADLLISTAHELTSQVEAGLRAQITNLGEVLIHIEPHDHGSPANIEEKALQRFDL